MVDDTDPTSEMVKAAADVINSKTVQRFYKEAVSPAAVQTGGLAQDLLKTVRLFTAPFQLAAAVQDRFTVWLDDVRNRVPEERQTEAPANVAGPLLMNLRWLEDGDVLKDLCLNLLTAAIDKDRQHEAHPGYARIIEQLSPDEAVFLFKCGKRKKAMKAEYPEYVGFTKDENADPTSLALRKEWPEYKHEKAPTLHALIEHLKGLGLLHHEEHKTMGLSGGTTDHVNLNLTHFGREFVRVCFPDTLPTESVE